MENLEKSIKRSDLFVKFLKGSSDLACFICICILVSLSSENPFESHIIGNLTDYFIDLNYTSYSKINRFDYNVAIFNQSKSPRLLKMYKEMLSEKKSKPKMIRKLVSKSFCLEIQNYFEQFQGQKLSNIFDLNYKRIHNISIANVVVCGFLLVSNCFLACVLCCLMCQNNIDCFNCLEKINAIIVFLFEIARFVLSIVLFYLMEKGDLEQYEDFLECENVRAYYFDELSDIKTLRECSFAFLILNVINQGIDKAKELFEEREKAKELLKNVEKDEEKA